MNYQLLQFAIFKYTHKKLPIKLKHFIFTKVELFTVKKSLINVYTL